MSTMSRYPRDARKGRVLCGFLRVLRSEGFLSPKLDSWQGVGLLFVYVRELSQTKVLTPCGAREGKSGNATRGYSYLCLQGRHQDSGFLGPSVFSVWVCPHSGASP